MDIEDEIAALFAIIGILLLTAIINGLIVIAVTVVLWGVFGFPFFSTLACVWLGTVIYGLIRGAFKRNK